VDCPDENTVVAYVEGRLPPASERRLLAHSDTCESCRELIAATAHALVPAVSPLDATEPQARADTQPLRQGQTIGRYVVRDLIGAGGMGVVYEAYDPELERKVALKLMRADAAVGHGVELRHRLLREAQAMARIRHPNVITIYDVGTLGNQVFLAMEIIEGTTLAEWLREQARPVAEIVRAFAAAGEGLRAAHAVGVVHRDFKPDNVLVGHDGRVCVTDFGLARPLGRDQAAGDATADAASTVTRHGVIVGTPAYMAPEQMRGETADARADEFSFCVALFEALHGTRPFTGRTLEELERAISDGKRLPHERRGVPARVRRALDRGLQADPAARFPAMAPLLDQLVSRRRAQLGLTITILGALALIVGLGWQRMQAGNRAQLCKNAAGKMSDLWSPAHQVELQQAVEKAAGPEAWLLFKTTLDRYSARWIRMHTEACEATHVRGEQSEALLDLRMDCLDQRFQDTRALTEILTTQPNAAEKAVAAMRALPSVEPCADIAVLRRASLPAIDPAKLAPVRAQIARARAEIYTDNCKAGLADSQAAATAAHALGAVALEDGAQFRMGDAQACLGNYLQAQNSFLESAVAAARAHDDLGVAHAYMALMQNSVDQQKFEDAQHWATLSGEAVERAGSDQELRADYLLAVCAFDYYHEHVDEAQPKCREAVAIYRKLPSENKYSEASAVQVMGMIAGDRGRFVEAAELYREAQHLFTESQGPESHDAIRVLESLATDELEQDHVETALALQKRVVEAALKHAWTGDVIEAQGFYGMLLLEAGRPEEAMPYFLRATGMHEKMENPPPFMLAVLRRGVGSAYLALGKPTQALPHLQQAWKLMPSDGVEYERNMLGIDFAKALWQVTPEHARALEIAKASREYLRKNQLGAYRKRKLAELDAWIQARDKGR
jgi:tetratricopeptide (TPR) repeat protein/predicted Ser/Thr protein kinase